MRFASQKCAGFKQKHVRIQNFHHPQKTLESTDSESFISIARNSDLNESLYLNVLHHSKQTKTRNHPQFSLSLEDT